MCCAATADLDVSEGGPEPASAADASDAGQAASAAVKPLTAEGPVSTGGAAVSGGPAAEPAQAAAGAVAIMAERDVIMGPAAAALAAWESVGNMLSDDDQPSAEDNNGDSVPSVVAANSAGDADAEGQSSDTDGGEGQVSDISTAEPPHRAELPGERSLEELGATLLHEKVLTASDVKGSIGLPEVWLSNPNPSPNPSPNPNSTEYAGGHQRATLSFVFASPGVCSCRTRMAMNPRPCTSICRQ